jgi:hypothetical protein
MKDYKPGDQDMGTSSWFIAGRLFLFIFIRR